MNMSRMLANVLLLSVAAAAFAQAESIQSGMLTLTV